MIALLKKSAAFWLLGFLLFQVNAFSETLVETAMSMYKAGDIKGALKSLKKANDENPQDITVIQLIGQIEAEREEWGAVKDWMDKALDLDADDLLAHYYLGIAYRETGKYKAFVLRNRDWKKAENNFTAVIENVPSYRDSYFQYSILQRYRKNYRDAIDFAVRQLAYTPDDVAVLTEVYQYYDLLLYEEKPEEARAWLVGRQDPYARLYLGESWLRNKEYARADSIFTDLLNRKDSPLSKTYLCMALARLRFQHDKAEEAELLYKQAMEEITTLQDAGLMFEDIKYILSDEEYEAYLLTETVADKKDFFKNIWIVRNPVPASAVNYRIREHIRRVIVADENFRFEGFRTLINNPDKLHYLDFPRVFNLNDRYNDKGLIYIRHGQPNDRATELQGSGGPMPADGSEGIIDNESWLYYASPTQSKMIFHFVIDKDATGNNWRLTPTITPEMAESRLNWDPIFSRLRMVDSEGELIGLQQEMAEKSRETVYTGLNTDQHRWPDSLKPIQFPFYVSTFRDVDGLSDYEFYYSLDYDEIMNNVKNADDRTVSVSCGIYTEDWEKIDQYEKTIPAFRIKQASDSLGYWLDEFKFRVDPGKYKVSVTAAISGVNKLGAFNMLSGVSSYQGSSLVMSSLVLASSITPSNQVDKFTRNGLRILPRPDLKFNKKELLHIYFEIYNLPYTGSRNAEFNINYSFTLLEKHRKNMLSRVTGLFSRTKPLTANSVERFANSTTSSEYLALDISKNEPGLYELEVVTQVPSNNQKFSRKIKFELQ